MKESPVKEFAFPTFARFISEFSNILYPEDGVFKRNRYLFRGQGSSAYRLRASFDRRFEHLPLLQRVQRYDMFVNLLSEELSEIAEHGTSEFELLGLAQHYGVPTRLLDWTSSPLVAAYFAFHERVSLRADDRFVSIWALDQTDEMVWNKRHGVEIARLKARRNDRASRQLGYATNLSTPEESIEDFVMKLQPDRIVLWKFNISVDDARAAFAFLDASNIRATELFGDIEGSVQTAVERLYLLQS